MTCASCNRTNREGARFCDACGTPLPAKPVESSEARKVVTIVFADLVGSTALHERLDAESARRFVERYYAAMRDAVVAHDGTVAKLLGDGVMAVFGVPRVAEDDAIRAVRAAVAMQHAFRELAEQQREVIGTTGLRVAVNTGEVVVKDETELIGDPVNVAARLQDQGRDGDVVIGEATQQLVASLVTLAPLGSVTLKGRAETVRAHRVVSLDRPASATTAAFVGRDVELTRLHAIYGDVITGLHARLAVVLGSPGLGKSRLMAEVSRRLADAATVLTAHCEAAGRATFAPLAKALREHFRIADAASVDAVRAALASAVEGESDRTRIVEGVAALLAGSPASPEETFFVVRRLLATLTLPRPVVLVIDDLQWAEPLLLDLVEHLVQWGRGVRLFVLVGARPELRDVRPALTARGGIVAEVVTLGGLDAGAAMRLAANAIGAADLPAAVAAKVLATSEGNPLFVAELVRMLVHEGALTCEGERWTVGAGLAALEMPPTIHALLAARIERLRPEERAVLERAAVVGRRFSRRAVAALLPEGSRDAADLDRELAALRRSDLIEPDSASFLGEPALRFHHVLIRDAAYRRLLKGTRAELHGRLADWIESRVPDAPELDETIGWHLEQAHQLLRELGPLDPAGRALGERAARHLAAAGRRALMRDDLALAVGLLGRALDRLDAADRRRADLAIDWCEALLAAGDVGQAAGAIAELARFTAGSPRLQAWHVCFSGQLTALTAPQELQAAAAAVAAAAETLASLDDAAGEAKAHAVHAQALGRLGRVGPCEAALDRALAAARRAGDRRRANAVLAGAPIAALWGPSPVTRASGRCLDVVRVLRITHGAPWVEAVALSSQGVLEALRGRTDAARRMIASSRTMVEELGITHRILEADVFAARIALLEGDAGAAEPLLRGAYEGLRELGHGIDAARAGALLGRALLRQGRAAEAEALSHDSEALAGDDFQAAIAWRGVRAEALARRYEHGAAIELAEAGVALAAATDALLDHADARLALAAVLRAAGRVAEADTEELRARELWAAKGATLLTDREPRDEHDTPPISAVLARPVQRNVRPNAATASAQHLAAALAARDHAALDRVFSADAEVTYHPTGTTFSRDEALQTWQTGMRGKNPTYRQEPLATLGDALALSHQEFTSDGFPDEAGGIAAIGAVDFQQIVFIEADADGRRRRSEVYLPDHLGDAVARLYARWAELSPDGPARDRAAAIARTVAAMVAPPDLDRYTSALAPEVEFVDHRTIGFASGRGADKLLRGFRSLFDVAENLTTRVGDVLRLEPDAVLMRWTTAGADRTTGGAFESEFLLLWLFGSDGRVVHDETFDANREREALARFDELTAGSRAASAVVSGDPKPLEGAVAATTDGTFVVPPNAASRVFDRVGALVGAGDWDALKGMCGGIAWEDRRRLLRLKGGWDFFLDNIHQLRAAGLRPTRTVLATAGDHLALQRVLWSRLEEGRASEIETIELVEIDADSRLVAAIAFDLDDRAAANAELFERGVASGGLAVPAPLVEFRRAMNARDLARLRSVLHADFVFDDHRRTGAGRLPGADAYLPALRALWELSRDVQIEHICEIANAPHGFVSVGRTAGVNAEGGCFESFYVSVLHARDARVAAIELFEPEEVDAALARFDALRADAAR